MRGNPCSVDFIYCEIVDWIILWSCAWFALQHLFAVNFRTWSLYWGAEQNWRCYKGVCQSQVFFLPLFLEFPFRVCISFGVKLLDSYPLFQKFALESSNFLHRSGICILIQLLYFLISSLSLSISSFLF